MSVPIEHIRAAFGSTVAQTARLWRRAVDRRLEPFGLTEATWLPLLRIARATGPVRRKDLAAMLGLDGSSLVRLIGELEAAGFVERRPDEDRRAKIVRLTARGRTVVEHVDSVAGEIRAGLLDGIAEREIRTADAVLRRICASLAPPPRPGSSRRCRS